MKLMVHNLIKYLKITKLFFSLSVQKVSEYRASFWLKTISISLWLLGSFVWTYVLFNYTDIIAGFTAWEYITFLGIHHFSISVFNFILAPGINELSERIFEGKIDMDLTKPISGQFLVTMKGFDISSLPNAVYGIITFIVGLIYSKALINLVKIIPFILFLILSLISFYSIFFAISILTFWLGRIRAIQTILKTMYTDTSSVPTNLYKGFVNIFFYFIFPSALMATIPASTLLSAVDVRFIFYYTFFAIFLFILSRFIWRRGLKIYSSASS